MSRHSCTTAHRFIRSEGQVQVGHCLSLIPPIKHECQVPSSTVLLRMYCVKNYNEERGLILAVNNGGRRLYYITGSSSF